MCVAWPACRQIIAVAHRETRRQILGGVANDADRTPDEMLGRRQCCSNLILDGRRVSPVIVAKVETGQRPSHQFHEFGKSGRPFPV